MEESKKEKEVSTGKGNHISRESVFNRTEVFVCLLFDVKWEAKTNFKLRIGALVANGERKCLGRLEKQSGFGHISFL